MAVPDLRKFQVKHELRAEGLSIDGLGDLGPVFERDAKKAIKAELDELAEELDDAIDLGDADGAEAIRSEIEEITARLLASRGIGGRDRKMGSEIERARLNVTRSIKRAILQIKLQHPGLGDHLRLVKTGTECSYALDSGDAVTWDV